MSPSIGESSLRPSHPLSLGKQPLYGQVGSGLEVPGSPPDREGAGTTPGDQTLRGYRGQGPLLQGQPGGSEPDSAPTTPLKFLWQERRGFPGEKGRGEEAVNKRGPARPSSRAGQGGDLVQNPQLLSCPFLATWSCQAFLAPCSCPWSTPLLMLPGPSACTANPRRHSVPSHRLLPSLLCATDQLLPPVCR